MRTMINALAVFFAVASNSGCAPVPQNDHKSRAKPFVAELEFVDQKSLDVLHCSEPDDRGLVRIIFATDAVDFDHGDRLNLTKEIPSQIIVEIIEERSSYKFAKPNAKYSSMKMKVGQFGEATFDIVQDGEKYILTCVYTVPKAKPGSAPSTETKQ